MTKKTRICWYHQPSVAKAFLFNCRNDDLTESANSIIEKGEIVVGEKGCVVAETTVRGFEARKKASFSPVHIVRWKGNELVCMLHPESKSGSWNRKKLSRFNYVVALLPDKKSVKLARASNLNVVRTKNGLTLVNLEIGRHRGQGSRNPHLATLLKDKFGHTFPTELMKKFHDRMLDLYNTTGTNTGYWAYRFLKSIKSKGGLNAARDWLTEISVSKGFKKLASKNRLDLAMEALILTAPYDQLFSECEKEIAGMRLQKWNFDFRKIGKGKFVQNIHLLRNEQILARAVVENLLPDVKSRRKCLDILAASIVRAHQLAPDRWGVSLFPDCIRLNVGRIEVLDIHRSEVGENLHVILLKDNYHGELDKFSDVEIPAARTLYKSVKGSLVRDFPASRAKQYFPIVQTSHLELVKKAAGTSRHPSTDKAHSPSFLAYLSKFLNRTLHQPSYLNTKQNIGKLKAKTNSKFKESGKKNRNGAEERVAALENIMQEQTRFVRSRDRGLANAAKIRAKGKCEACEKDFSQLLDGLGTRVLQAHHRNQMSVSDTPRVNRIADIAVLCANCHVLIHVNPKRAINVDKLRAMLNGKS